MQSLLCIGLIAVDDNSLTVPGTFNFKFDFSAAELDYFSNAGTYSCAVKFDPADSVHFNSVECIRTIEVLPLTIQYRFVCEPPLPDIVMGVALPDCTKHIRAVNVSDNITVPGVFDFTPKCFVNPGPQFVFVKFTPEDPCYTMEPGSCDKFPIPIYVTPETPTITGELSPVYVGSRLPATSETGLKATCFTFCYLRYLN